MYTMSKKPFLELDNTDQLLIQLGNAGQRGCRRWVFEFDCKFEKVEPGLKSWRSC